MRMAKKNVLLVGESWVSAASHTKGWDSFSSVTFHLGAEPLVAALRGSDFARYEGHEARPSSPGGRVVQICRHHSIGHRHNTFAARDVWLHGKTMPSRLKLIRDWTMRAAG
jgi:uncharacterized membrane protein